MINNFVEYLILQQVSRITNPYLTREQSDLERTLFESALSGGQESQNDNTAEIFFLRTYFRLPMEKLKTLTPEAHAWIIERAQTTRDFWRVEENKDQIAARLAEIYMLFNFGSLRFLIVKTLLTMQYLEESDTRSEKSSQFIVDSTMKSKRYVVSVWNDFLGDERFGSEYKIKLLGQLTDILIDIRWPQSLLALSMLVQLERELAITQSTKPIESRILKKAEFLGGEGGAALLKTLSSSPHGHRKNNEEENY